MTRRTLALIAPVILVLAPTVRALEPLTRVIPQAGAPIRITAYGAAYQESGRNSPEGIRHTVAYENAGDRTIAAVEIVLVSFDVWNEFLDRTAGLTIRDLLPGAADRRTWVDQAEADYSFQTGIAYVNRVRYDDGSFWSADRRAVTAELKKLQPDFDAANLHREPVKK